MTGRANGRVTGTARSSTRPRRPAGAKAEGGGFTAGFRFIAGEPVLRAITIAVGLALLAFGFTESASFSVVTLGLHHSASFVGVLVTIQGVGAVIGGVTAAAMLRRMTEGLLTALGLSCAAVAVLLLTVPSVVTVLAGMAIAGPVGPWCAVAATTAMQRRAPSDILGRVAGAFSLSLTVPQVTSIGLGAALIATVSYRVLLTAVAVVAAAAVTFLLVTPGIRRAVTPAETPVPEVAVAPET